MSAIHAALLVVTDLDGCLLDSQSYSYEAAKPALAQLARAGWPLVLCSGKTRAEMGPLSRRLGLHFPFIVENGGAIVFPDGAFPGDVPGARVLDRERILDIGAPRASLVQALETIALEAQVSVRGFAEMSPAEVQALTGLSAAEALLAMDREYDEPFLMEPGAAVDALVRLAEVRGFQVSHGGRFHHLMSGSDKGLAVRMLRALYQRAGDRLECVGLGDAETDLALLGAVDRPIVVPRADGSLDPILAEQLPDAECARVPGPTGWNAAILGLLAGQRLPRVGSQSAGRGESQTTS